MSQSFLLGVPGKIKAVYDHLTTHLASARAAKIDNLDAAISTRAAASTALSNATWTNALASILGNTIQTTVIASIQTGYVSSAPSAGSGEDAYYKDTTITAVASTAKCVVLFQDQVGGCTARLTSTTNLRVSRLSNATVYGRFVVVEFK
jgi:hypothetical protein